jgi:protein ImuB
MERLACIDLPEFPLQLLLSLHPEWKGLPAAVVAKDKPQGEILVVSPEARSAGVLPGMRYAEGLSLAASLRAGEISASEVRAEVMELAELLRQFSPEVEISREEPGVFWVNAAGLSDLFSSLTHWACEIHAALAARERRASVAVGFRRFAVYAVARGHEGVLVLSGPEEEEATLRRVSLSALVMNPRLRETLAKLAIFTLGDFLRLPAAGIRRRFGDEAARLHTLASGDAHDPFSPDFPLEPVACTIALEVPEDNSMRLAFAIGQHLQPLLALLAARREALRELEIRFLLERQESRTDRIQPADPTLDEALILDLVHLRLEGSPLSMPVTEIGLTAHGVPAAKDQLRLFLEAPRRDLDAANRALARVRAELGEEAVVRAKLKEGHLPEARFAWEPLSHLPGARPRPGKPMLVRRQYLRPLPLDIRARRGQDGRLIRELPYGLAARWWGPYVLSGEWRRSSPVHRRYYFVETQRGNLLWVYYDALRRRWFLQGHVE